MKPVFGLVLKVERINYPPFYPLDGYAYWYIWLRRYFFFKKRLKVEVGSIYDLNKFVGARITLDPTRIVEQ